MLQSNADLIVVGSGLFGLTIAQQAAATLGLKVLILEKRSHIGGNAYSEVDSSTGIEVHKYGSHLFHCSSDKIWDYVNRFSTFTDYKHHVITEHLGKVYPMPINLGTICSFFERVLTPTEARALVDAQTKDKSPATAANLEDKAIALIGEPLYNAFIRGYTKKQWQTDPKLLPPDIITRLPVRYNFDTRYFSDKHEGLPTMGYGRMLEQMLKTSSTGTIAVEVNTDFFEVRDQLPAGIPIVYTGALDRYFDYRLGTLQWRTLDFIREEHGVADYQGCAVMNFADESEPYTRVHEFRHLHPERTYYPLDRTVTFHEYSRAAGRNDEPYYPVSTAQDKALRDAYQSRAAQEMNVIFGGRLGSYQYLDMHQAIGAGLAVFEKQLVPYYKERKPLRVNRN